MILQNHFGLGTLLSVIASRKDMYRDVEGLGAEETAAINRSLSCFGDEIGVPVDSAVENDEPVDGDENDAINRVLAIFDEEIDVPADEVDGVLVDAINRVLAIYDEEVAAHGLEALPLAMRQLRWDGYRDVEGLVEDQEGAINRALEMYGEEIRIS